MERNLIMNKNKIIQKIDQGNFRHINGTILRTLNVIAESRCRLSSLEYSLRNDDHDSFINSIKYLNLSGYIELVDCNTKKAKDFYDGKFEDVAIALTAKGIRVLSGALEDDCVEV